MQRVNNILVVADRVGREPVALRRALPVARAAGARVHLVGFVNHGAADADLLDDAEAAGLQESMLVHTRQGLETLVEEAREQGVKIDLDVVWHDRIHEWIIDACLEHEYELVIKTAHRTQRLMYKPTDWHLLRACPAPVLLAIDSQWPRKPRILAAVDVSTKDAAHKVLNRQVLDYAAALAQWLDAELHCGHAFPEPPVLIKLEQTSVDPAAFRRRARARASAAMGELCAGFSLDDKRMHLREGSPSKAIASICKKIKCEIVVMGTVARAGLKGAVLGNTAEKILANLDCDVLAVKPSAEQSD